MTFGQRLINLREERGLYQKDLAPIINVSASTISNYENNIHYPDVEILCKLAEFFDVSTDYLLGRTNYRHNPDTYNQILFDEYTVADFANTILELNPKNTSHAVSYVNYLLDKQSI